MDTTLTIRVSRELREKLRERAELLNKTDSELVRELLVRELAQEPLKTRIGYLRGRLRLEGAPGRSWREQVKAHNWRP